MMELYLHRLESNAECVTGELLINGIHECVTLELPLEFEGAQNVHGKTCIPEGRYQVDRLFSPHFNRLIPHVMNVPNRSAVEIHPGNTAADIRGCILLGEVRLSDTMIGESQAACKAFEEKFDQAIDDNEEVWLEISAAGAF
jgi:hypothetical protein